MKLPVTILRDGRAIDLTAKVDDIRNPVIGRTIARELGCMGEECIFEIEIFGKYLGPFSFEVKDVDDMIIPKWLIEAFSLRVDKNEVVPTEEFKKWTHVLL